MKAIIKPKTANGHVVIANLEKLAQIFLKPATRFIIKAGIPKKYRRGVLGFKLEQTEKGIIFSMKENPIAKNSEKEILKAVHNLIKECDGEPTDVKITIVT